MVHWRFVTAPRANRFANVLCGDGIDPKSLSKPAAQRDATKSRVRQSSVPFDWDVKRLRSHP